MSTRSIEEAFERYIESMGKDYMLINHLPRRELFECFKFGWEGGIGPVPDETNTRHGKLPRWEP